MKYEGTKKLLREASTPRDLFRGREVQEMPGLKHDLLANAPGSVLKAYLDWAAVRLAVRVKGETTT